MQKWVYSFGPRGVDGSMYMRNILGGKGASLADMSRLGLNVPAGFTLTTKSCKHFFENDGIFTEDMIEQVDEALLRLEGETGRTLGNPRNPLIVSVRPGAFKAMPGMMETVLFLGVSAQLMEEWVNYAKVDKRLAWNAYRRYLRNYGELVLELSPSVFDQINKDLCQEYEVENLSALNIEQMRLAALQTEERIEKDHGLIYPEDPKEQLYQAIKASFLSWKNPRAEIYRQIHNLPEEGIAVTVQLQALGLKNDQQSGSGYCYSRNPETGEHICTGFFAPMGLGEDYLDPKHQVMPLKKKGSLKPLETLEAKMPWIWHDLLHSIEVVEKWYGNMRQIEFCVEDGKLWLLQAHQAEPKTPQAALRVAVEMVKEGMIRRQDAVQNIRPSQLEKLLHPTIHDHESYHILSQALGVSPGAVSGHICLSSEEVFELNEQGKKAILVVEETKPNDVSAMMASKGVLTVRGGSTSHAAVIARSLNCPCITAASDIKIDKDKNYIEIKDQKIYAKELLTIDGHTGMIYKGEVPISLPQLNEDFDELMSWVDKYRDVSIRANGETVIEMETAKKFGAEGMGLIRTEYMFLKEERLSLVRQMILSATKEEQDQVLEQILPMQRADFLEIFKAAPHWHMGLRLLDPPLHEFLPDIHQNEDIAQLAQAMGCSVEDVQKRISSLRETNPMLGHRGARLAITSPNIYKMQTQAMIEAAFMAKEEGYPIHLEIIVPLITLNDEIEHIAQDIKNIIQKYEKEKNMDLDYQIGTMIETPRAALRAGDIARSSDFFSFGTNDLTQMTWGLSRDDSNSFIRSYYERNLLLKDPFQTLDDTAVGELIKIAVERARATNPNIIFGLCGEQGGDPKSIEFFTKLGLDYISCSPWRVPVARLAAAQAALKQAQS